MYEASLSLVAPSATHVSRTDLFHLMFENAPQAQILVNPFKDKIDLSNKHWVSLLGYEQDAIRKMSVSKLFSESLAEWLVFTQEVLDLGCAWCDHLTLYDCQNLPVSVETNASKIDDQRILFQFQPLESVTRKRYHSEAQHHYRSGIVHWDRTSRVFQEFERENQLILNAAGEGIYGVDLEGKTTFVNAAAERILGWTQADLLGKNVHNVIHHTHKNGEHFHSHECSIFQAIKDGMQRNVDNEVFWTNTGKAIDVEYTSTPIRDQDQIVGAVVIFRDVTQKKLDKVRLLDALAEVEKLKNRLEMEKAYLQEEIRNEYNHHHIVGKSPAVQTILGKIAMVAPTDATVLIVGESGTGKELIARAIHDDSHRKDRSLVRVNCAAIPADLFESEFFGHRKGAFTGATDNRVGRFELADGGTLFLDEVGEIPINLQGKLLRVLQEQSFERVGDSNTRHVDVRILAATNKDLRQLVAEGKFREDLYFRLNVFPIQSAPLRERREDIALLAAHFLKKASQKAHKPSLKIPLSQIDHLQNYDWPGNIRELENVIERQVILARGNTLVFEDLPRQGAQEKSTTLDAQPESLISTDQDLKQQERQNILSALKVCHGKVSGEKGAAKLLNVKPTTLSSRIKKYCIDVSAFKH